MGDDTNRQLPTRDANTPLTPVQRAPLTDSQRAAAAEITRGQIDRIYERDNPYERTHVSEPEMAHEQAASTADHMQKYHTAWQDYYQKYYESYYTQAVKQTADQLKLKHELEHGANAEPVYSQPAAKASAETPASAVSKLQASLKDKVTSRANSIRRSRHFWPLITAGLVAGVFLFLQYNRLMIANVAAYVSPGNVDPQNIIVDPSTDTKVGPENKIVIPKINVDAPADYSVTTFDNDQIEAHLKNGVVHYAIPGANALPGQLGNVVIGGHSSNDVFDDGNYKFVFVQLEKLAIGDTFYLNYNSTRYTYHITKTQTIDPDQIDVLTASVSKPTVTLITCTPVGTALHRFLVFGEQVSPDPSTATAANNDASGDSASIPGNSPTLLQRVLGQ